MLKRIFALFLAMTMVFSMLPVSAFAADDEDVMETIEETEAPEEVTEPVTEPETVPEETEEAVPEETEAPVESEETEPVDTEEPTEEVTEETSEEEEPEETEVPEEADEEEVAMAASGKCGLHVNWTLDDGGTLSISGIGKMDDYRYGSSPWYSKKDTIVKVIVEDGVENIGDYAFYNIGEKLVEVQIGNDVKTIGENSFYGCAKLNSIVYGSGVEKIGSHAFYDCTKLSGVVFGNKLTTIGEYAFGNCTSLWSVVLPDSVTTVDRGVFCYCSNLSSVTIGKNLCNLSTDLFLQCTNLSRINVSEENPAYCAKDGVLYTKNMETILLVPARKSGRFDIPQGIKTIGERAFTSCTLLTQIGIPKTVNKINRDAFSDCSNIRELYLDDLGAWCGIDFVYSFDIYGFNVSHPVCAANGYCTVYVNNKKLESLKIPSGVSEIKAGAFAGWKIKDIEIPDSVKIIGAYAFLNCGNSISLRLGNGVERIGKEAFRGCSVDNLYIKDINSWMQIQFEAQAYDPNDHSYLDHSLKYMMPYEYYYGSNPLYYSKYCNIYVNNKPAVNVVIPRGITEIHEYAFYKWYYVETFEIPDSVTSIGGHAFAECSSLIGINIPDKVTYIGEYAFSNCRGMTAATIGKGVNGVSDYAFSDCVSLKKVVFKGSMPTFYCWVDEYNIGNKPVPFRSVRSSVYYPCNDSSWNKLTDNDEEQEGYYRPDWSLGGDLTWIADHSYEKKQTVAPTCTEQGYVPYVCSICGDMYGEDYTDPIGHSYGESWKYDSEHHWQECSVCGNTTAAQSHTPDEQTAFSQGIKNCTVCGYTYAFVGRTGTCGKNLTWVLDENGKMTISGTGAMDDYEDDATPWNDLLPQIKSAVIEPGVTHLGDRAFQYASNMSSLSMPETLTSCGQYVFHGCTSLTAVRVPESLSVLGVGMFHSCSNLKSVTLPDGLKGLADWVFCRCTALTSFTIPQGITEISKCTFYECTNLTSVNLPNVTKLGPYAFYGCTKLGNITIPDSVETIDNCAFRNCSNLTDVTIPANVKTIGSQAFNGCSSLKTMTFEGNAPTIAKGCFSGSFTANYPCSGKNWSSAVFKDTGATPKMVKYHPEKYYTETEPVEPTCTEPGSYGEIRCGSCGTKIKSATVIPALGHSYEAVVTPPTCTTKGFTTYTCSACGDSYTGNETGLAPHTYQDGWFSSQEGHWHYCTVCSAQSPVEPHVPDRSAPTASADQLCKVCGYIMQTRKPLIVIDAPNSLVVAGKTMQLSYHVVPEQAVNVVWKLGEGDEAYATVSETGKLTAKAVKEQHTITVYAEDAQKVCVTGKVSISVCPVPTEISILEGSAFTVNVNEGGSLTFTAKCGPAGSAGNVVWKTSDSAGTYSSFRDNHDNTCAIYDLKLPSGKAASITLTASVAGTNVKSSVVIKLVSAPVPGSIRVSGPETLRGGTAASYKAAADMDEAMTGSWVFALRSQDSAYASITAAGKLTTKAVPEAVDVVVSAYTKDYPDVVGSTVVHLVPSVQQVTVQSPEAVLHDGLLSVNLAESKTLRLEAAVQPVGALQTGSWKTSSAAVATVDGNGLVRFNKAGTVTITFTANDGSKKSASVKICAGVPMMDLQINGAETLVSGDKATLQTSYSGNPTIKKLVWSSSDTTVATVTASGVVTAKTVYEEKTVTITAKATDGSGETASHIITVLPKANVLPVWDASGNVVTNQTLYLDTQTSGVSLTAPAGAKWSSSAPKVVSVDNGRLTLLKAGSATITVKSADGKQTAKVTIKVSTLVRSLTIVTDCSVPLTSGKGKLTLKTAVNADASNKAVTWKSSNPDVAAVTSAGAVSAKAGVLKDTEVVITATAKDGSDMTAQVTVKVIPAATAVHVYSVNAVACADGVQLRAGETLNGRTITLPVNKSFSLGAKVFPNALGAHADQTVAWKSSSAKIAEVDENGVVTSLKAGTVTITVKTADGKTNTVKIKFV